jgi:hypothetical protein
VRQLEQNLDEAVNSDTEQIKSANRDRWIEDAVHGK